MQRDCTFEVTPLAGFGAEVDCDLSQPLTSQQKKALRDLFFEHQMLIFRGQSLTLERQCEVMGCVGPVENPAEAAFNYVTPDDAIVGALKLEFHSDVSFIEHPLDAISLYAVEVVEGESYTDFISAQNAWRDLPDGLRKRIEGRMTVSMANFGSNSPAVAPYDVPEGMLHTARAMPWPHPVTGNQILYISRSSTGRVEGLGPEESRALLDELLDALYAEEGVYRHVWRNGDFIMWDNFCLQHGRPALDKVTRRVLQRATVARVSQMEQVEGFRRVDA